MSMTALFRCCLSSTWIWIVFSSTRSMYSAFLRPATSAPSFFNPSKFPSSTPTIVVSIHSTKGKRSKMEDCHLVSSDGRFAGVFDGHGGSEVSQYIKSNVYSNFLNALPEKRPWNDNDVLLAFRRAISKVDSEVTSINKWSHTGSTLAALYINTQGRDVPAGDTTDDDHVSDTAHRSDESTTHHVPNKPIKLLITTANVGDSRIVLGRGNKAIDLTVDHKPFARHEKSRIHRLGGVVRWHGLVNRGRPVEGSGVYRVNGNLSLSRAIGDAAERPCVSGEPDIRQHPLLHTRTQGSISRSNEHNKHPPDNHLIDKHHEPKPHPPVNINNRIDNELFVILATDGLWDVFTSQEAVSYVLETIREVGSFLDGLLMDDDGSDDGGDREGGVGDDVHSHRGVGEGGVDRRGVESLVMHDSRWMAHARTQSQLPSRAHTQTQAQTQAQTQSQSQSQSRAHTQTQARIRQRLLDMDLHPRTSVVTLDTVRARIAKGLVKEALRRGSGDNITVVVQWLH